MRSLFTLAIAVVALASAPGFAQQAKVIKVQGKKAIVQFPDDARPRVGQVIDLGGGGGEFGQPSPRNSSSRKTIVGGSTEFSSLTPSGSSTSTSTFVIDGRYGINMGEMEFGGVGGLSYASSTGTSARILQGGGFFDFNLEANKPGTEVVYGVGALAKFGSIAYTAGNTEQTGTLLTFEGGGQFKWFPLGNSVAIRGDLVYRFDSISDTLKTTTLNKGSGFVAKAGFYIYF